MEGGKALSWDRERSRRGSIAGVFSREMCGSISMDGRLCESPGDCVVSCRGGGVRFSWYTISLQLLSPPHYSHSPVHDPIRILQIRHRLLQPPEQRVGLVVLGLDIARYLGVLGLSALQFGGERALCGREVGR